MGERLTAAARKTWPLLRKGLLGWPYWGFMLFVVSIVYKLNWLDHQFDVGGMNDWKWKVNYGAVILTAFWTLILGRRARWITLVALDLALSALLFSDLIYFRYFKDFISVPILFQAGQVGELGDSIWSSVYWGDMILFADLPLGLAVIGWIVWRKRGARKQAAAATTDVRTVRPGKRRFLWRLIPVALSFAIGWSLVYYPVEEQKNGWARGLFDGAWWNIPIYNVTGLLGFHGYDAYRYAKENWLGDKLTKEEEQEAKSWFDARKAQQKEMESEPMFGEYKGKNVLVVQMEAFQQFVIGQSINGEEITPNLNKLIGQSMYFPNFYHQTGQGHTSDADFSTSCSMHPLPTGSVFIRFSNHEFDCAPAVLKTQGYDTTVHHAYDGSFWNRNNMYNDMEYDQFYSLKNYKIDEPLGWSLGDKSFFRQTVNQLVTRGESPFYAMAITLSSHNPFNLPSYTQTLKSVAPFDGTTFGNYLQALHYVDEAVGELIEDLKNAGLYDNTILVFYGDHDNQLYDMDAYDQFFGRPLSDMEKDAIVRKVPYVIHLPNDEHAGVYDKSVGQLDTLATIMHLLGVSAQDDYLMGVSALSAAEKPVVFRNGGFTDGSVYFVPSADGVADNGTCYSFPEGEQINVAACKVGAEAARNDLLVSDRTVEHDLIAKFRNDEP